jgi:AraC family transcriptional regulator, regulatory protein of adaptative response / DNA-3-methyladenine glycosylase II
MNLEREICYRALQSRDARFDGRFFTGVTSTGVYCRPVCPARTPRPENCAFFACAAAAEAAGFRPCRRCRPETAPGTPAWQGTSATVTRALRLIDGGALDDGGVDDLAARLGVGARHLRRLFASQLGVSPRAVALTRRVHLARQLLEQTQLPVEAVALAVGFESARRLRAAFATHCGRSPLEVRRSPGESTEHGRFALRLGYRPPMPWDALLAYLAPRAIPGVEVVGDGCYRRSIRVAATSGILEVAPDLERQRLILHVPTSLAPHVAHLVARVRALFDLDADPGMIAAHLDTDPLLVGRPAGLRVPGTWDPFELAVRAILGQQITVAAATRLAGRLVRAFGRPLPAPEAGIGWVFPAAAELAQASAEDIAAIGMPVARGEAIRGFAAAVVGEPSFLSPVAGLETAVARLTRLPGCGPWTAHYVALRGLREPDAFPSGDLHLRRALAAGGEPLTPAAALARAERWRPFRGYAALRLWTPSTGDSACP